MTKIASSVIACSFLLALSTSAHALNTRSFISANGLDTNSCARTAPCRTLQKAHDSTSPGGEINMLDPAGYGTVTITKAISIVNDGVGSAGVLVPSGGTGITINAGVDDAVNLRGLIIEGAGSGTVGIQFNTGGTLNIQNSVIRRLSGTALQFAPSASSKLFVSNTLVSDNGGNGIFVIPSGAGAAVTASINYVELDNNSFGGVVVDGSTSTGTIKIAVADSVASNNVVGFQAGSPPTGAITSLMLVRCVSANNGIGVKATGSKANVLSAQSTAFGNTTGWEILSSGFFFTYLNNYVDANGTEVSGSTSTLTMR